jgi:hypothetical protein
VVSEEFVNEPLLERPMGEKDLLSWPGVEPLGMGEARPVVELMTLTLASGGWDM